ncbi:uncharacterized protein N7511_010611 [Penicillium nucicola]|uniref:uncharacterized protein n=1 Tax=Penicillium nucicola TaxID=1850975 RepID=UPI002545224A|nr:uncharacterized protein N7511_010611 [Penicillium nucicola]KAJ5748915.1 hypothetical protein N7511_010611 [Penicillium nucicola]
MPGQFPDPLIDPNYAMYATFQRVPGSYIPPQNGYFPPQAYYNHTYQTTPVPPPYFQAPPAPHQRYAYGASFQYPYSPPYSPYQNHFPIPKNDPNTPQPTNQPFQNDFNHPHPHPTPTPTQPLLQLTYEKLPQKDLHHPLDLPVLPEGWDWRLDNANRIFYVDTYAHGHEKRCFWKPPIEEPEEEEDGSCLPPGWERTCTIYGRVFWTHVRSRIVSYEFPGSCPQFKYSSVGELYLGEDVEREGVQWRHWSSVDLGLFWVDDSEVACRISRDVWQDGISDEAVKARGSCGGGIVNSGNGS